VVIKPPKVRMTSDGIGGKIFSNAINRKIPIYPKLFINSVIQFSI
jgi:hypothetical protein